MEENSGERKKCNKCAMMIPKEAKICPFCRKQQGWSLFTKFFLVVAILFLVTMIVNQIKNNTSTTGQPPNIDSSKQEQNMQKSTPPAPVVQKATPPNTDAIVHNMNVLRKAGLVTKVDMKKHEVHVEPRLWSMIDFEKKKMAASTYAHYFAWVAGDASVKIIDNMTGRVLATHDGVNYTAGN